MTDNNDYSALENGREEYRNAGDVVTCPEFGTCDSKIANGFFSLLLEGIDVFVTAMVAVIIVFVFVFKVPTIEGRSMNNTLFDGERVIITNLFYEPEYGDIVVISRNFSNNTDDLSRGITPIIKRVIATAGQTVDIKNGIVTVDGRALYEPYTTSPTEVENDGGSLEFPITVPENCVFVLGDNRSNSTDSRRSAVGMIDKRYILGKAILRVAPFDKFGKIE